MVGALKAWFDDRQAPRRTPAGHWVPPGARLPAVHVDDAAISLLVGRGATVGSVQHAGSVTLTRQVNVQGGVSTGRDLVVGAGCHVAGGIDAGGRVVLQNASVTGPIRAAGDVLLLGACQVGDVVAGGDIVVFGKPRTGRLEPGGRVATRAY
jgi:predicted acyltransferase (DUF342 family)